MMSFPARERNGCLVVELSSANCKRRLSFSVVLLSTLPRELTVSYHNELLFVLSARRRFRGLVKTANFRDGEPRNLYATLPDSMRPRCL